MCADVKNSTFDCRFRLHAARKSARIDLLAVALIVSVLIGTRSQAQATPSEPFVSSEGFWVMCTSNWGNIAYLEMYAACRAYVAVVADVLAAGQPVGNNRACFNDDATKGQATEVVIAWMRAHPQRKDLSAVQITAAALAQKYPCS
ncbi:MAG: hypothetical protein GY948_06120 [Alphaproteobacteria bacterium]|nr:hypothetical protein [Alphaproteobacteria bacterium]